MKILIIDNYDSFTYNLYQYAGEILSIKMEKGKINEPRIQDALQVRRNNQISLDQMRAENYTHIIISPGPGDPQDPAYFGVSAQVLTDLGKKIPVLGVCLGMQGMASCFGGKVVRANSPMHGKTSLIVHDSCGIFSGLPQRMEVMRYHSLVADPRSLPDCLQISAYVSENSAEFRAVTGKTLASNSEIMGLRHKEYPIEGIQFHPESFATEGGKEILANFLR